MQIEQYIPVILAIAAALLITFAATPIVKSFAHRVGAIDVPKDGRRMHTHPIPRLGGLAIFLGFLLSVVLFANIDMEVQGILLGAVVVVIVGVIDDIVPLPALLKFTLQIVAALIAVFHGVEINIISNPAFWGAAEYLNFGVLTVPVTVLWIVAITNSVNLIDGLDGLAAGVSAISSFTMLIIALVVADLNVAVIMAALAGSCLGFLPYNRNPARIFMGDTGALLLGYILATVSIIGLFKFYAIISFVVPVLVVGLPLFDTAFAIVRRVLRGRSPMSPDRGHFHHRLIDMGLSQKQAVAIAYAISGILGLSAVVITTSGEIRAIILVAAFFVAGVIGVFVTRGFSNGAAKTASDGLPAQPNDSTTEEGAGAAPSAARDEADEPGGEK
jgi:UDP-GlcNAc:undecaprenyl-phosphate GlcNAc-1-phosphate transferase